MSLGDFTPETRVVEFPGGEFAVRGLSLEDFTVLLRNHYDTMAALFDRYVSEAALARADEETGGKLDLGDLRSVALGALEVAPALIADCIARAADETENPHVARLLPTGVQVDAIIKIVGLTLEAEGGLEKLLETVEKLAASLSTLAAGRSP